MSNSSPQLASAVPPEANPRSKKLIARITANAAANLVRLFAVAAVAILLPAYLARHLQRDIFNIWVLVIQVGSFVSFLEIGIQTAVSKFVAEHHALDDLGEASLVLTNATVVLSAASLLGLLIMAAASLGMGRFLHGVSPNLLHAARMGVILYGGSLALSLPASAFAGVFLGLQRNFPVMLLQSAGKIFFAILVVASIALHAPVVTTIALAGAANLLTAIAQVLITRAMIPQIRFAVGNINRRIVRTLLVYCSFLSIWSVSMLLISGLDTTLVAHFDFAATASYAIAATLTSFITSVQGSMLSPLIPATSALSKHESPSYLGQILSRFTRYTGIIAVLTCIPFFLFGYRLLIVWVGHSFAAQAIHFLWILSAAVAIRQFSLTYAVMVVGLGQQKLATISPSVEAVVNLTCSILLAQRFGAIGIAWGTLIGSFIGLAIHIGYSMRLTRPTLSLSRTQFVLHGILRPAALFLPTLLLAPLWMQRLSLGWAPATGDICATLVILYYLGLNSKDRDQVSRYLHRKSSTNNLSSST